MTLAEIISAAGGVAAVAEACEVSKTAVYKWIKAGRLPRTDYSGETRHCFVISKLCAERRAGIDSTDILRCAPFPVAANA